MCQPMHGPNCLYKVIGAGDESPDDLVAALYFYLFLLSWK
jgi:hypothetical protein